MNRRFAWLHEPASLPTGVKEVVAMFAASTAYQPAFFSWNQRRTGAPLAIPAL
jgi:hypothetical protein